MRANGLDADIVSTSYTQEGDTWAPTTSRAHRAAHRDLRRRRHRRAWACSKPSPKPVCPCPATSPSPATTTPVRRLGPISLTSVDQAGRQIGGTATRLLLDRIADRTRPSAQVRISPTLVVRRSTARPPT
jgi:LacI family transcriptional regulator